MGSVTPRRLGLVLALVAGLGAAGRAAADAKTATQEAKQLERVARIWGDYARYAFGRGYSAEAAKAGDLARRLLAPGAMDADLVALLEKLGVKPEDDPAPDADLTARKTKAEKDAAKVYDKLADLFEADSQDVRFAGYLLEGIELEPSKGRIARLAQAASKHPVLVKSPAHPMVAWLSLPDSWKAGKEFPVLVTVEGAGANFLGNHNGFRGSRGSRDVILVSPYALSCTNELKGDRFPQYPQGLLEENAAQTKRVEFDVAGLEAILDLVTARFGGSEKVAITGFSGGGFLSYGFTLRRPERVALCAPACPNFLPTLADGAKAVEGGGPPVRIFTGEKDEHRDAVFGQKPGIEGQADWAEEAFAKSGFRDVKRTMLPGVGHSSCVAQVWAAFDEVLGAKR